MKTLEQYRNRTKQLVGQRVRGINAEAEVPAEGAIVTANTDPSTVRIGFLNGEGSIGLRGLEELAFLEKNSQDRVERSS